MSRIKVCQVINSYHVGGAETVALNLARGLDPERYESLVVAVAEPRTDGAPEMLRRFQDAGVPAYRLYHQRYGSLAALWDMFRFFRRHRPDIVHGHNRPTDAWAYKIGKLAGVPHRMWTRHLVYDQMRPRLLRRYRSLGREVPVVAAVSDAVREHSIGFEHMEADRIRVIVNGIDTERFRPLTDDERLAKRQELGLAPHELMLLQVGRLAEQKAPQAFLSLIDELRSRDPRVWGFLCGTGPLAGELEPRADEAGVTMLGLRNDVPELLGAADLVVSCSRVEGLPLNIMEAMAAGAPFVGPGLDQIRQLISTDERLSRGLYTPPPTTGEVPAERIAEWAEVTAGILADADWLETCRGRGPEIIGTLYSLRSMIEAYEQVYRELATGR